MDNALVNQSGVSGKARKSEPTTLPQIPQTRRTLLAYGGLALPLSIAEIPIVLYLPAFYAQELRLSAGLVGVIFLSARLWDGFSDILSGYLSDRSMSRWGRRKPWAIIGSPFLMVSTWFLCNPPPSAGFAYLALWAALFYTAFTAVKIPHLSWGTELATDYVERSRVTGFRETFTMLGNLFFATAPLLLLPADAPLHRVLLLISLTVLCMVPLTVVPLTAFVRDPTPAKRMESHLLKGLSALARDRILIGFAVATLIFAIEEGVTNSLLVFSINVGLQLQNKMLSVIFILYITTLCALPLTLRLSHYIEKNQLLAGGVAIQAIVYGVLLFVPKGNVAVVYFLYVAVGIANTAMLVLPTSILADIIDHGEATTGERRSGEYVAVYNLVFKVGMAVGVGLSFGLLQLLHYDPGAAHHGTADARDILIVGFGLPCLLSALSAAMYLKHPITKSIQRKLRGEIDARRLVRSVAEDCAA
jgi:glycoside/pentoside/hexuronide:cation symporter, GPH family